MRARHQAGTVQPGKAITLAPVPRVSESDLLAAITQLGGWATPRMIWRCLSIEKRYAVSIQNLQRRLRHMQQDGKIERLADGIGPEYRMKGIEE